MSEKRGISWAIWGAAAGALLAANAAIAQGAAPGADAAGAVAAPNAAAPAAPKPKPKKPAPAKVEKVEIVVTNKRAVELIALLASVAGSPENEKIAGPLGPGKKAVVRITPDKNCLYDLHGLYADGATTEAVGVPLCKDKTINLVD